MPSGTTTETAAPVTLTEDGYLRIDQQLARQYFPDDTLVVFRRGSKLLLMPTRGAAGGGLILKQRNAAGDRAVLLAEQFNFQQIPKCTYAATWDNDLGALTIECHDCRTAFPGRP